MAQAGDDTITLATGADLTGNLTGGDGEDSLVGGSGADTFTLTGTDSGTMDKLTTGNTWAEIENLSGGDGDNTFAVETGGEISGSLTGGVGTSTMDYSARSDSLSVTFTGSSAEGFAAESAQGGSATAITNGFTGIDALTAGRARDDTLTDYDVDAVWTLANSTYAVGSLSLEFSGFDRLIGDSGKDGFTLSRAFTADLDGAGGDDTCTLTGNAKVRGNLIGGDGDAIKSACAMMRLLPATSTPVPAMTP